MRRLAVVPSRGPALSPDDPARIAVRVVFRFHAQRFREHEASARAGDVEGVHHLRVATRRLRAALRLFQPILPVALVADLQRELGWLADTIGAVRDLDVLAQQVNAAATRLTIESRRALGPVALAMHEERRAKHDALVAALDSPRARRLIDRLGALPAATRGAARLGTAASELVRPLLRTVLRTGRGLDADSPPAKLHRLRVRVKRLRYALETLRTLAGKDVGRAIRRLSALQDVLGVSQDGVMAIGWLRTYAEAEATPPTVLVAVGGLIEILARGGRKARRQYPDAWEKLDRRGLRAALLRELQGPQRPARADQASPPRAVPETGS